ALVYVTGGFAFADVDFCAADRSGGSGDTPRGRDCRTGRGDDPEKIQDSEVLTGFTAGTGVEVKLTEALSAKAEYIYVDLGRETFTTNERPDDAESVSTNVNLHVFRAGLNYNFGRRGVMAAGDVHDHAYDWSGFYVGVSGGVAGVDTTMVDLDEGVFEDEGMMVDLSSIDGIYGIQVGYNRQLRNIVLGLEADFSGTTYDQTELLSDSTDDKRPDILASAELNWLSTLRAKAGLAVGNTLLYVTGGLAIAEVDYCGADRNGANDASDRFPGGCRTVKDPDNAAKIAGNEILTGFTAGTGFEMKLTEALSLKSEYLYVGLDREILRNNDRGIAMGSEEGPGPESMTLDTDMHLFRVGLNYRFGRHSKELEPLK
ncbi:MAG: outer membrane protein, partial [Hyphomicrobiaceae bacterium]